MKNKVEIDLTEYFPLCDTCGHDKDYCGNGRNGMKCNTYVLSMAAKEQGRQEAFSKYNLIPARGLSFAALVMEHGKKHDKDGKPGWVERIKSKKGRDLEIAAIKRHIAKIEAGEDIDQDSGYPHAAHIAVRALILANVDYEFQVESEVGHTPSGLVFMGGGR